MPVRKYVISFSMTGCPSRQVEIYQLPKWTLGLEMGLMIFPVFMTKFHLSHTVLLQTIHGGILYVWKITNTFYGQLKKKVSVTVVILSSDIPG